MSIGLKRLQQVFTEEESRQIRNILTGKTNPRDYVSVQNWLKQCFNEPSENELKMEALNEVLKGFGVEAIRGNYVDSYYQDIQATYVNMGDTYDYTILFDSENEKFVLTSWGDWVESHTKSRGLI